MKPLKEAMYYEVGENQKVHCNLCPQNCIITPGNTGLCRVRKNIDGKLYSLNYGKIAAAAMDPIEKKPLYHFCPGRDILSVGSIGCNLECGFCQNFEISQEEAETTIVTTEEIVRRAVSIKNNIGIAFTYNEPSIWFEFMLEVSKLAKAKGLKTVLVTNGYIQKEPLRDLLPYIDAMNIDVKAFQQSFYGAVCKGNLQNVKATVEMAADKCHVEVTNLVINTLNDKPEEFEEFAVWLAGIDPEIPLHISRYFPNYKMDIPKTRMETLVQLRNIALKHLKYVYIGNAFEIETDTHCPECGELLVRRNGYMTEITGLKGLNCKMCGKNIMKA